MKAECEKRKKEAEAVHEETKKKIEKEEACGKAC